MSFSINECCVHLYCSFFADDFPEGPQLVMIDLGQERRIRTVFFGIGTEDP